MVIVLADWVDVAVTVDVEAGSVVVMTCVVSSPGRTVESVMVEAGSTVS